MPWIGWTVLGVCLLGVAALVLHLLRRRPSRRPRGSQPGNIGQRARHEREAAGDNSAGWLFPADPGGDGPSHHHHSHSTGAGQHGGFDGGGSHHTGFDGAGSHGGFDGGGHH